MTDHAMPSRHSTDDSARGWRWAPAWVLAFVALWPAVGIAGGVAALGAITVVLYLLFTRFRGGSRILTGPAWALTSVMFFAYWFPQLISIIDSVDPSRALREALGSVLYLPFLWLVAAAVATARGRRITLGGLAIIVGIWTIDALLQAVFGTSPLFWGLDQLKQLTSGHAMCTAEDIAVLDRLSGFLGPCNLKLGVVLASMSPFLMFAAGRRFGIIGWVVAAAAVGIVILLAGARAAWITFTLVLLFSGWSLLGWKRLLTVFAFGAIALTVLGLTSTQLRERLERTAHALAVDQDGVDTALSGRAQIWGAAWCMIERDPINGVGARGFRKAFPSCDPLHGGKPAWGKGPALHAHQIVLEVLSETGIIGLLLWLAGAALAWRAWRYASPEAKERARPAMVALAVTVFPFNTHLAFYSTFWGGLTLMLAAFYTGSLLAHDEPSAPVNRADTAQS